MCSMELAMEALAHAQKTAWKTAAHAAVQLFWGCVHVCYFGMHRWSWPLLDFINEAAGFVLPLDVSEMHLVCLTYSNHIALV